jgi:hypothetical protein
MIDLVDTILAKTLLATVPGLSASQIGFQPPDADWRARVGGITGISLNVHLATIAEDRPLRTNAVHRETIAGQTQVLHAPERVRLHYIISAWSQGKDSAQVAATQAEHALLGRVLTALYRVAPLNASRTLSAADIAALPEALRDDLPTSIAPQEVGQRLGEFWSTMGRPQAWKPVIDLFVTMPVVPPTQQAGGIVETILADSFATSGNGVALATERTLAIGGLVHSMIAGPIPSSVVELHGLAGGPADGLRDSTLTDSAGHFAFAGLAPGTYEISFSHPQHPTQLPVLVTVPLASGHVDLVFP